MGTVVVVSGLPAAGKSTLARRLAADLRVPLVARDELKAAVFDDLLSAVPDVGPHLGVTMNRLVRSMLLTALDAGIGVVVDGNFNRPDHADVIREVVAERHVHAREVCLWGDVAVLRQRFADRARPPITAELEPYLDMVLNRERWTVLDAPQLVLHIDATKLTAVDAGYSTILRHVRG